MKNKILIAGLFMLFTLTAYAQYYVDGYVVKESGDTIFGKLERLSSERSCLKIKFIDSNGNKVKFKDSEVYAYKIGEDLYFKKPYEAPIRILDNMIGFMKLIDDGKVKLYEFSFQVHQAGGPAYPGGPVTIGYATSKKHHYLEKNEQFIRVKKMGFKQTMSKYFSDSEAVADKIKKRHYRYKDIVAIVEMYNR